MDFRVLALFMLASTSPAFGQCRLCGATETATKEVAPSRPLSIEIETTLDFSRVAQGQGGGSIAVDERTGARSVQGGLIDLGGYALKGVARMNGDPGRHVRVELPGTIILQSPDGGTAQVVDLRTDLPSDPVLDASGQLSFSFGGRLVVSGGTSGDFRGRVAIIADYQ